MIDYYLKKYCLLRKNKSNMRCSGCVWHDKEVKKCIFAVNYQKQITLEEFKKRIELVNTEQQNKLSNPSGRFVL